MKLFKKILKITGISLLSLIVLALLIPILFKKQITRLVKKEINKSLNAKVDFSDVRLSLLKHFPRVTIIVKDLSIVGSGEFKGDTLLYSKKTEAAANLFSVIRGKNINVYGAYLRSPRIHILVDKEGKVNWDIVKKTSSASNSDTSASAFKISLKNYAITDGYIEYKDESANTYTTWDHVNHRGAGDITQDEFTLSTFTHSDAANFTQDDIPYLVDTKTDIVTGIKINTRTNTYTFKTDKIIFNNLRLNAEGFFKIINNNSFDMDVKFNSPSNDFKDILSLVPAVYKKDFNKLQTSGNAVFSGFVKGNYSPGHFPAYDVTVGVTNGSFKYPDLPKPVKNIQLDLHASNTDGLPDHAVIDVSKGHLEMDNEPFDFKFIFKNPQTVKYIDAAAKGKVDLAQLSQFIKLTNGIKLSGLVWADAYAKGNLSSLEKLQPFNAGGFFDVKNLFYSSKDFPEPIKNGNMKITLDNTGGVADNTRIYITTGHIEVGTDPLDFNLQLSNPMSTMDFSGNVKGRFTLANAKQFATFPKGTSLSGLLNADLKCNGNKDVLKKGQYDKMNLAGAANLSDVKYITSEYPSGITISTAALNFNPANANISTFSGNYMGSNFSGNGTLSNLIAFIAKNDPLGGNINMAVDKVDLNKWMGTSSSRPVNISAGIESPSPPLSSTPFAVPSNLNITLNTRAGTVTYDKVDYNNINGKVTIADQAVKFQDLKAEALDGSFAFSGSYSSKLNKQKPDININYDIRNVDVQKAFYAFNPVQSIMPIGKFLSGKLSSALSMTGNMKGDMALDLKSLAGKGNFLLLQGVLKKFAPLEKIAQVLDIDRLKSITVKEIKNYFEFANGKVLVKPFTVKIDSIEMLISGFHGFDGSIDYAVQMKLPRNVLGSRGVSLMNNLSASAQRSGLPFKLGQTINLSIKVNGTISSPVLGINFKGMVDDIVKDMEQQAKDFLQAKLDSARQKAKDSLNSVKKQLEEKLKDKLLNQIFGKDTTNQNNNPPDTSQKKQSIFKKTLKGLLGGKN